MTEKEKILAMREGARLAAKHFYGEGAWIDDAVKRLFPLPPEKVPNVQRVGLYEYRQDPDTGRVQIRFIDRRNGTLWDHVHSEAEERAIRAVIAEPYRLVSGEDGET